MTAQPQDSDCVDILREALDRTPENKKPAVRSLIEKLERPTVVLGGVISAAGQRPGRVGGKLRTSDGLVEINDALQVTPTKADPHPNDDVFLATEKVWAAILDDDNDLEIKSDALGELLLREDSNLPDYIIRQFEDPNVALSWKGTLAAASEQVKTLDARQRTKLKECLFVLARQLKATHFLHEEITWAAVRHYGSIIDFNDVGKLLEFLAVDSGTDTRQVALQAIQRIFEQAPPSRSASLKELSDRVFELARTYLQPDIITYGSNAALALNAVHALAAIADPRVIELSVYVAKQDVKWFLDQLDRVLVKLRSGWMANRVPRNAVSVVDDAISAIAPQPADVSTIDRD